jgi:hypothetical protein
MAICRQVAYLGESAQYLVEVNGMFWKRHDWNPDDIDRIGSEEMLQVDPHDIVVLQAQA